MADNQGTGPTQRVPLFPATGGIGEKPAEASGAGSASGSGDVLAGAFINIVKRMIQEERQRYLTEGIGALSNIQEFIDGEALILAARAARAYVALSRNGGTADMTHEDIIRQTATRIVNGEPVLPHWSSDNEQRFFPIALRRGVLKYVRSILPLIEDLHGHKALAPQYSTLEARRDLALTIAQEQQRSLQAEIRSTRTGQVSVVTNPPAQAAQADPGSDGTVVAAASSVSPGASTTVLQKVSLPEEPTVSVSAGRAAAGVVAAESPTSSTPTHTLALTVGDSGVPMRDLAPEIQQGIFWSYIKQMMDDGLLKNFTITPTSDPERARALQNACMQEVLAEIESSQQKGHATKDLRSTVAAIVTDTAKRLFAAGSDVAALADTGVTLNVPDTGSVAVVSTADVAGDFLTARDIIERLSHITTQWRRGITRISGGRQNVEEHNSVFAAFEKEAEFNSSYQQLIRLGIDKNDILTSRSKDGTYKISLKYDAPSVQSTFGVFLREVAKGYIAPEEGEDPIPEAARDGLTSYFESLSLLNQDQLARVLTEPEKKALGVINNIITNNSNNIHQTSGRSRMLCVDGLNRREADAFVVALEALGIPFEHRFPRTGLFRTFQSSSSSRTTAVPILISNTSAVEFLLGAARNIEPSLGGGSGEVPGASNGWNSGPFSNLSR